jgi:hypothetical protein
MPVGMKRGVYASSSRGLLSITPYSGTDAEQAIITNQNLASGSLGWFKATSGVTGNNTIVDTERGITKAMFTDLSASESTVSYINSFNSTGVTIDETNPDTNSASGEYVLFSWLKRAGYLDMVPYNGNADSDRAIAHALGSIPALKIIKNINNAADWAVSHKEMAAGDGVLLNSTAIAGSAYGISSTPDTDTNFYVNNNNRTNETSRNYIALLFAEQPGYSVAGTYEGTGAAGNSITGLGLTPKLLLTKNIDNTEQWQMTYNDGVGQYHIVPNGTNTRAAADIALEADGFTPNGTNQNISGQTYIYMAWA